MLTGGSSSMYALTEEAPLISGRNREIGPTAWRWYIIFVFALLATLQARFPLLLALSALPLLQTFGHLRVQSMSWNIYAPVSQHLRMAYGSDLWSDLFITWAENTSNVTFVLALPLACYGFDRVGARTLTIVSAALLVASTVLRVLPLEGTPLEVTVIVSMSLNGVSGPFFLFGAPIISQLWFSVSERTVATAIGSTAPYFGSALGFLVGPYVVGQPRDRLSALAGLQRLYSMQLFGSVLALVLVVLYFPDKPERPPSQTADNADNSPTPRNAAKEWMLLLGHADVQQSATVIRTWLLILCFAIPLGVYASFGVVLDLNLGQPPLSLSTMQAGFLGAMMTIIGCLGSVLVGFVMDRFVRELKTMIVVLMFTAAVSSVAFAVDVHQAEALGSAVAVPLAYITAIVAGFASSSTIPLFFELIMETTFGFMTPNAVCSFVVFVSAIVQIAFLCVPTQINGSVEWMNWTVATVACVFGALVLAFRPKYLRLDLDAEAAGHEASGRYSGCI
jgi:nitrate/nitrite transporter NarK